MSRLTDVLKAVRADARLSPDTMARLAGLDEQRVLELEKGALPMPQELDSYALAFGVTTDALARGEVQGSPAFRLLLRATEDQRRSAIEALADTNAHRVFGDFLRAVSQLAELDRILGRTLQRDLPRYEFMALEHTPPFGADRLAGWLRDELELGTEPIPSMRALFERVGVPVFFVTPEELDPAIDGASTSSPRTAVLVNLVEGPGCWWRTRMTLAHELCHLLVDHRDDQQPAATISPYATGVSAGRKRYAFYDEFELVERRAGAFAAHFLAPNAAVRRCVGQADPTSEESISRVARKFGIGRYTACYRLKHVYGLAEATHRAMISQGPVTWEGGTGSEDRAPAEVGLRAGVLRDRALDAFVAGKIDGARCREYLNLRYTEPLPPRDDLTEEQRKPLRAVEDTVRGIAQHYLQTQISSDLVATTVTGGKPDGWHVSVVRQPRREPAGSFVVTYDRNPGRYLPPEPSPHS